MLIFKNHKMDFKFSFSLHYLYISPSLLILINAGTGEVVYTRESKFFALQNIFQVIFHKTH